MIEVVEDQIDLPLEPAIPESMPEAPLKAVFISRISPMKNLHTTLRALSLCTDPITFSIYGPIEDEAYWNKCLEIIQGIPINIDVCYRGVLPAGAVRETFTKYDLFIFPTLGENFGHVIAESLSASCAVICSDKTPWSDVLSGGGGIALSSPSADLLSKEIQRFSRMTADERRDLRIRVGDSYRRWRHHTNDVNILERAVRRLNSKGFSS
ncbi:glycosyltransferase [Nucisporomicrobium flavum]|uniref:glycosyltransferase n=1 Tax=Nucisporomicrobium flavum TaxID=2785915 RepID=UPI0018F2CDD9|nr:glycosyltransferase [Nucisporomicrobium flavum]